ncbi:ATP-grasp domain-containing protein [Sulfidibacter corallicola]|uniref:ATP-grasp domain-containing protein n=1 Tax=Sulfidibacter corallicola TaxID=2818388 RepID=A0A8A4TEA8_SULCO|nr:ATP-grasp domain-containing protein [Sulfidibacter corallicola]QTD47900.1 ATP-grasp domain-containing protein [Sulfidibacter corallicola]
MNVLLISPGYPADMPHFTRGLAEVGARVYGIGDTPEALLPRLVQRCLSGYLHVRSLWDEEAVIAEVFAWKGMATIHRVECLWEPGMMLAARLREALGVPGLDTERTLPFRNKELMKRKLDDAGLRTPRHRHADSIAGCWEAAEEIGYPLILKPIDGAGSMDTYRVNDREELRAVLPRLHHVPEVSIEEFVEGEEFTFDTICIEGRIAYFNVAWYRPRPLIARSNEWISPQVIALRQISQPMLTEGLEMGHKVIEALDFQTGFTHMEWYRKESGEVVFGEIAARPPGAHQVDQMKFACNFDVYREWGRAICWHAFEAEISRDYNVATVYKRAQGHGHIQRIEGLEHIQEAYGEHLVWDTLLPIGAQRRNWRHTLVSDGFLMLRHPDLDTTLAMADDIGCNLHLYAG